jgi:hypothetical protein
MRVKYIADPEDEDAIAALKVLLEAGCTVISHTETVPRNAVVIFTYRGNEKWPSRYVRLAGYRMMEGRPYWGQNSPLCIAVRPNSAKNKNFGEAVRFAARHIESWLVSGMQGLPTGFSASGTYAAQEELWLDAVRQAFGGWEKSPALHPEKKKRKKNWPRRPGEPHRSHRSD